MLKRSLLASDHTTRNADALRRKHTFHLCVMETSGAVNTVLQGILRVLARAASAKGAADNTRYGHGRASTRSFYAHHVAEMSTAVQVSDAIVLGNSAASTMFQATMRM